MYLTFTVVLKLRIMPFSILLTRPTKAVTSHPLLIHGDFTAPRTAWGYNRVTKKGRLLWEAIQTRRLRIESDPCIAIRTGNSVQAHIFPDLTLSLSVTDLKWQCTPHNLADEITSLFSLPCDCIRPLLFTCSRIISQIGQCFGSLFKNKHPPTDDTPGQD